MVSLEEACEFLISHQGASVSSIKCSNGILLTTFKLSSVFKELRGESMLLFWQSRLLFRTEFRWSLLSLLRNYDWKLEVGSADMVVSWLFFQIFWSEIKQAATDWSNFQSEKQSALYNSRSRLLRLLLIKIHSEFLKNSNRRNQIICNSLKIHLDFFFEFFKNS